MRNLIFLSCFSLLISQANAEAISSVNTVDSAILKKVKSLDIKRQCLLIGKLARNQKKSEDKLREVLAKELGDLIQNKDYLAIVKHEVVIGMHMCAVIASIGVPEHVNTSHLSHGDNSQMVYKNGIYIYTNEEYRVTSWQD